MNKYSDSEAFDYKFYTPEEVKSRMLKYQSEVIDAICEHYQSGAIDDEIKNHQFMNLIACLCEGKIIARRDEKSDKILWKISDETEKKISGWKNILTNTISKKNSKTLDKDKESK